MTTDAKLEEIDREFDWAFEIFRKETPPACHGRLSKLKDTVFRYIEALKQASERIRASHKRVMDRYASLERMREAIVVVAHQYALDENLGDTTERFKTILWVASDGKEGKDWGHEREHPKEG